MMGNMQPFSLGTSRYHRSIVLNPYFDELLLRFHLHRFQLKPQNVTGLSRGKSQRPRMIVTMRILGGSSFFGIGIGNPDGSTGSLNDHFGHSSNQSFPDIWLQLYSIFYFW